MMGTKRVVVLWRQKISRGVGVSKKVFMVCHSINGWKKLSLYICVGSKLRIAARADAENKRKG